MIHSCCWVLYAGRQFWDEFVSNIQWDSMHSTSTTYSNLFGAGISILRGVVVARDERDLFVTKCLTYTFMHEKFMRGAK